MEYVLNKNLKVWEKIKQIFAVFPEIYFLGGL